MGAVTDQLVLNYYYTVGFGSLSRYYYSSILADIKYWGVIDEPFAAFGEGWKVVTNRGIWLGLVILVAK